MVAATRGLPEASEALVVALARTGDRDAFAELVRRRQAWIRRMMRCCCDDPTLADDLAQQTFLQAWKDIGKLRDARKFGAWLKRLAINTWRQYARRNDVLRTADEFEDQGSSYRETAGMRMDLDHALATLATEVRRCLMLSYHEGMSHPEIAELTELPVGTVKSHIRRGSERLKTLLVGYEGTPIGDET